MLGEVLVLNRPVLRFYTLALFTLFWLLQAIKRNTVTLLHSYAFTLKFFNVRQSFDRGNFAFFPMRPKVLPRGIQNHPRFFQEICTCSFLGSWGSGGRGGGWGREVVVARGLGEPSKFEYAALFWLCFCCLCEAAHLLNLKLFCLLRSFHFFLDYTSRQRVLGRGKEEKKYQKLKKKRKINN